MAEKTGTLNNMYKDLFSLLVDLDNAISSNDLELMTELSLSVEVAGTGKKLSVTQLDILIDKLLTWLEHYRFSETMGGWRIFNIILSYVEHFSDSKL